MASPYKKILIGIILTLYLPLLFSNSLSPEMKKKVKASEILELNKHTTHSNKDVNELSMLRSQILYLFSRGDQIKGLKKYKEYFAQTLEHDYKLLREMSLMIIEDGIKGQEVDSLLSLIAIEITGEDCFSHHLGKLINSNFFPVQAKTLSLLRGIDNDHSDMLIKSCLSSNFLMLRLEALSILVQKHNKTALGQVEALMNMVHKNYHPIFVDFYAIAGTKYALSVMKQMMNDRDLNLNLAAVLAAKKYRLEELIPNLRKALTHTSGIIQEAAAAALGVFHDSHGITKLETLCSSKHTETSLAALYSLYCMGKKELKEDIVKFAKDGNHFAISILPEIVGTEKTLHEIYYSNDNDLRINSAIALLDQKDPLCLPVIKDLITIDTNVHYLHVIYSPGRAFSCIKLLPLASLDNKQMIAPAKGETAMIQNQLLAKCIDLPRDKFMQIIDDIFTKKRNSIIPTAISLLENFDDEESLQYLLDKSKTPGAPFIRTSCHLSLWKSTHKDVHYAAINRWLARYGKHEMISISQKKSDTKKNNHSVTGYELSLEEKSHLLIQSFLNLAASREKSGLDCILDAMINGHEKNRIPLAGVLLKTIQ